MRRDSLGTWIQTSRMPGDEEYENQLKTLAKLVDKGEIKIGIDPAMSSDASDVAFACRCSCGGVVWLWTADDQAPKGGDTANCPKCGHEHTFGVVFR